MDRASSKDKVTSERQRSIAEPETESVPFISPSIHHATADENAKGVEYDSADTYVPMFAAASYLNEFEMSSDEDAQEADIHRHHTSEYPLCVSSDHVPISENKRCQETGYSIAELVENTALPQVLQVTQGHTGGSKQESLNEGDVVLSHCLISRKVVVAESKTGVKFTVPLKSHHKFFLVQANVNEFADMQKSSLQFTRCTTVAELLKLPQLPCVVRATSSSKSKKPYESVEKGTILLPQVVVRRDGRTTLVAKDLNGDEKCLKENCKGGFELRPKDTWLLIDEIVQHCPLPTKVFLANHQLLTDFDTVSEPTTDNQDCTQQCQPFTLLCETEHTYLIISKHNKPIDAAFNSELVLEVPTTLSIRMKCIPLEEKQQKSLIQLSKTVYEHIQVCPGQLVLDNSAMTDEEHKLQEVLYLATFSHNTVEQIRGMAGGRPKVRLPASLPVARMKKRSHTVDSNEQNIQGTIIQLKADIQRLEALLRECKSRLQGLEMNLHAAGYASTQY